jgi:hypothetical protein
MGLFKNDNILLKITNFVLLNKIGGDIVGKGKN